MNKREKIAIHWEGGLGDCMLAHRLTPAVLEKHPNAEIDVFINTDGNPYHESVFKEMFPYFYNSISTLPKRKTKEFKINTILGEEIYGAHLNNLPDEVIEKFNSYDAFYNFHIDGLYWTRYDIPWQKYFKNFSNPPVNYNYSKKLPEKFVMAHLYARPDSDRKLEDWYVDVLMKKISKNHNLIIVVDENNAKYYEGKLFNDNIQIHVTSMMETMAIAQKCSMFIGMDSCIRYMPIFWSKPSFVFNKYCTQYGSVPPHQIIRWALDSKYVLPMHFDANLVSKIIDNTMMYPYGYLFPEYSSITPDTYAGFKFPQQNSLEVLTVDRFFHENH